MQTSVRASGFCVYSLALPLASSQKQNTLASKCSLISSLLKAERKGQDVMGDPVSE